MPASVGVHGPGEMITRSGAAFDDLVDRDLIVAKNLNVQTGIDLAQPLHEVVGKRIVVIDDDDHVADFTFSLTRTPATAENHSTKTLSANKRRWTQI